jgi:NAD(P)-dependent dehydrogenase (short-subunit alcohol dehydrogenase family)
LVPNFEIPLGHFVETVPPCGRSVAVERSGTSKVTNPAWSWPVSGAGAPRHARGVATGGQGRSGARRAVAYGFAAVGCRVLAAGLPANHATSNLDGGITVAPLDVSDAESIRRLVAGLEHLDILINGAGIIQRSAEYELETFERVIDVNLTGIMRVCTACRPLLAEHGGSIINIASMLSFFGSGLAPAYSASKGGIAQLTKSLAIAWAADNIRVNAVAPGWIATPLTQELQDDPARTAALLARTPLKRWGRPEDVVGAVVFLCSPAAGGDRGKPTFEHSRRRFRLLHGGQMTASVIQKRCHRASRRRLYSERFRSGRHFGPPRAGDRKASRVQR